MPVFLFFLPLTIQIQVKGVQKNLFYPPSGSIGKTLHNCSFVGFWLVHLSLLLSYELGVCTVRLVDFCTCAVDCCALFPFLCQSYVAVLKQLSFNLKNYVFFSCNH
jgi:hypothetical protein